MQFSKARIKKTIGQLGDDTYIGAVIWYSNCKRKLEISTVPTKAKLQEPAYLQALVQNKIDRQ